MSDYVPVTKEELLRRERASRLALEVLELRERVLVRESEGGMTEAVRGIIRAIPASVKDYAADLHATGSNSTQR